MNSKIFAGIDPGQKGAISFLSPEGEALKSIEMPPTTIELYEYLNKYKTKIVRLYLEKSASMPGNGVASMFTYGKGYGAILAVLDILKIPYDLVAPTVWHPKIVGRTHSEGNTKQRSAACARRLWPEHNMVLPGCKKIHDGIVDSLLIAEYGRLKNVG